MIVDLLCPLREASNPALYGAKAANLSRLMNVDRGVHGVPVHVPAGFAIDYEIVRLACEKQTRLLSLAGEICARMPETFALRSSVIGEDGDGASFAGQHLSVLNVVNDVDGVANYIVDIFESASDAAAVAYRLRRGITGPIQVGIIAQTMVRARISGVMFTGGEQAPYVIEAGRGLGEAVAQGLINPDYYQLDASGLCQMKRLGDQEIMIAEAAKGGVQRVKVEQHAEPLLDSRWRYAMFEHASQCQAVFGPRLDIEWAIESGRFWILQVRPTTGHENG